MKNNFKNKKDDNINNHEKKPKIINSYKISKSHKFDNKSNLNDKRIQKFKLSEDNKLIKDNKRNNFKNSKNQKNKSLINTRNNFFHTEKNLDDWIWGKHSVLAALTSDKPINRIWCTSDIFSSEKFYILLKDHKKKGVLIEEVSWSRISQLTYGAIHQGIALQVASSKTILLNKLIEKSKSNSKKPIIIALDGITDPHNIGAIIRSSEAFGCKGIIIPQRRSSGLTGTVAKVAAGALEYLPVSRVVNLNRSLTELKNHGFTIIGLSEDGQTPINEFKGNRPLVIVIGSEDKGISLLTQKNCDYLLRIPLKGSTSSLNASVAAAISLATPR